MFESSVLFSIKLYVRMKSPWKCFIPSEWTFLGTNVYLSTKPIIYAVQEPPNERELMQ